LIRGICLVIALLPDGTWALASGTARDWRGRSARRREWMTAGDGVALIGLGAALAVTGRKK
jgi:threonine/homoserine/homoserine lactone efflux protein